MQRSRAHRQDDDIPYDQENGHPQDGTGAS